MEYYEAKNVAEILGLPQSVIFDMCEEGLFPRAEQDVMNHSWKIPKEDIEKYLEKLIFDMKNRE